METIAFNFKGFYFFDYELEILKEKLGLEFKHLKRRRQKRPYRHLIVYKVLEDPEPVEATKERLFSLKHELPFMLNAISFEDARLPCRMRCMRMSTRRS